ncbi:hypothetical protein KSP39_PZI023279 [Platanthera zijinensis]|uniref:Uncharacterized protein n=1 Tax=Platanthera zijinensis TaxID=2320716 RepID=A0AAP0FUR4_9ASPA
MGHSPSGVQRQNYLDALAGGANSFSEQRSYTVGRPLYDVYSRSKQRSTWLRRGSALRSSKCVVGPPCWSLGSVPCAKSLVVQLVREKADSPPPPPLATVGMFEDFRQEVLSLIKFALGVRAECSTPAGPVTVDPALGEDVLARRAGKEVAEEGSGQDLPGRVLFLGLASAGRIGDVEQRDRPARPVGGSSPFSELVSSAPVPQRFRESEMSY